MSWLTVILFAVIAGIYSGLVMLVPALENTSFQDIGISYECWVVFAVIIVVNCEKSWDAALKCFVFFLISQPLCYLTEILLGDLTVDLAKSYYFATWLPMTFLTMPGGFIAYFCKKQNALGGVILGLGNTIQLMLGTFYFIQAVKNPPYHLLSAVFCFASAIIMTMFIHKQKKNIIISLVLPVLLLIAVAIYARFSGLTFI